MGYTSSAAGAKTWYPVMLGICAVESNTDGFSSIFKGQDANPISAMLGETCENAPVSIAAF